MPLNPFEKFGFSAGVVSGKLHSRSDLEKYDLALKEGFNWIVDPLGGLTTRPGSEFVDFIENDDRLCRTIPFKFNSLIENTYTILFEHEQIRFLQDGAYVLENSVAISSVGLTVTTAGAHNYSTGDWVKIAGQTLELVVTGATTFTMLDPFGNVVDLTGSSATSVARIYTIASPYSSEDLRELVHDQTLDELVLTHPDYERRKLTRTDATNWSLDIIVEAQVSTQITNFGGTSGSGTAGQVYLVTVLDAEGKESLPSSGGLLLLDNIANISTSSAQVSLSWDAVPGAIGYRIYRSLIAPNGINLTIAADLGYIGETKSPAFLDTNIIPDFTQAPYQSTTLFTQGAIENIEITAPGSSYDRNSSTLTVSGGGSGFDGKPVVNGSGEVIGVLIFNRGSGYVNPIVTIATAGSGATATATATSIDGNNPAAVTVAQQRRIYAGTENNPNSVFGSRTGIYDGFADSGFARDTDPFLYSLDQREFTPIRHMRKSREGLFLFAENEITQLRGVDDAAITPNAARAIPQTEEGVGTLEPLVIEQEYLYLTSTQAAVKSLRPSNLPTYFVVADRSRLAQNFIRADNPIVSWCWAQEPSKLVWAVRADGTALTLTFDVEVNVWAWMEHQTAGFYEDVSSIFENNSNTTYSIVRRKIGETYKRYIERSKPTDVDVPDDMWGVDSGLGSTLTFPSDTIEVSGFSGTVEVTGSAMPFTSGDVGKHFRAGDGFGIVTAYNNTNSITVDLWRPITQRNKQSSVPPPYSSGGWSLTEPFTTFSGLEHLEGREVEILADGSPIPNQVVINGSITLDTAASQVVVGLGFTAEFATLPPSYSQDIVAHLQKHVKAVYLRLYKSAQVYVGDGADYYTYPETDDEPIYDIAPNLKTGLEYVLIAAEMDYDGAFRVRKTGPVQAHVLGYVAELEHENA